MTDAKKKAEFVTNYQIPYVYEIGLSWGAGIDAYIKRLEKIADDHSYSCKTTEQKYNPLCDKPYL